MEHRKLPSDCVSAGRGWKQRNTLARSTPWPDKVIALLRAGNADAAIAQIRVAPNVRELRALEKAMEAAKLGGKWRNVDAAIAESLQALAAPRLHRSP
jgi:hypothetical protein